MKGNYEVKEGETFRGIALEIRLNQRRHFLQRGAGVMLEQE
jgi:hypothetical protein